MCGGLAFPIKQIAKDELVKYFNPVEIARFEKSGQAISFFWDPRPVLPVKEGQTVILVEWGNRDKDVNLPKTGWAKEESVNEGKWAYLKPKFVSIPVEKGYEKGVWFEIENRAFKGMVIEQGELKRAYIITKQADSDYLKLTRHDRQPVEINNR